MGQLTRRQFIVRGGALLATIGFGFGGAFDRLLADGEWDAGTASPAGDRVLVVVQLNGGNDGINTLIPFGQGAYYDSRPTLKIAQAEVLALNDGVGLHPSLNGLYQLYQQGKLAVIQGVGYPNPNRSHFRSMDIWQTAQPDIEGTTGWLGRYAEQALAQVKNPLKALTIGHPANRSLTSERFSAPMIESIDTYNWIDPHTPQESANRIARAFIEMYRLQLDNSRLKITSEKGLDVYESVEAIQSLKNAYQNSVEYPNSGLAKDLQLVCKMLAADAGTKIFYVQLDGFDDHANEKQQHADLLKVFDQALTAFYQDLEAHGWAERTAVMTFSEFGRRVRENGNKGTDHGTAAPVFVLGGSVNGGLYGQYPSLSRLDKGDLKYEVDFRSIYSTLIEDWLKGDAKSVLGGSFEKIAFV